MATRIWRLPVAKERTRMCRSTIVAHMELGKSPGAARIGAPALGWREDEIDECIKTIMTCPRAGSGRRERTGR